MSNKEIKVLITSLEAGKGHQATKDFIIRSLKDHTNLIIKDYHSEEKIYDTIYRSLVKIPGLWGLIYDSPTFVAAFLKPLIKFPELLNAEKVIEHFNPDIIICTHSFHSVLFLDIRKNFKLNYKVVTVIPDYGEQRAMTHKFNEADYYWVSDDETREIISNHGIKKEKIYIFGNIVNENFTIKARLDKSSLAEEFKELYKRYFPTQKMLHKKNLLFIGGSGWTAKSYKLITKLGLKNEYNIFVNCGKDEEIFSKLQNKQNIFPFGFIPHTDLAVIENFADLSILSSLGRATLAEVTSIAKYPIFGHKIIGGQEAPHVEFLKTHDIGIFEPNDEKMMLLIEDYFGNPEKYQHYLSSQKDFYKEEIKKAKNNYNLIEDIAKVLKLD